MISFEGAGGRSASRNCRHRRLLGTRAYITNNDFFDNAAAPISDTPDGMLAADPLTPLISGNAFFRGNVMVRNDLNGMEIFGTPGIDTANLHVDSVWDDTDLVYILRSTIVLAGSTLNYDPLNPPTSYLPELRPFVVLTIQAGAAGYAPGQRREDRPARQKRT